MALTTRSVLITGGAGFIGCALAERLVAAGDAVTVLDVLHPQVHTRPGLPAALPPDVTFFPVDVTGAAEWDAVLRVTRPDAVVHLAAETGTGQSLTEASRHARVNVVGTTEMLDALHRTDAVPEHVVLASSRAVYGEGLWQSPSGVFSPGPRRHAELAAGRWDPTGPDGVVAAPLAHRAATTAPRPTSVYGATKLAQEHVLSAWAAATGCPLSVLRLQNVFGPGQAPANSYTGIVMLFVRLAAAGQVLDVYEDGQIVRDFVFIDDVVTALATALDRPPATERVVDVGSGRRTTIGELAQAVAGRLDAPAPKVTGRFRDGDVRAAWADTSAAAAELDYVASWDLAAGLEALLDWMKTQGELDAPAGTTER